MDGIEIKKVVRERYGEIAKKGGDCGCSCGCNGSVSDYAENVGYSKEELEAIPQEANLGLSCGNPTLEIISGETVLDLGSGAGFDAFLASKKVGASGKVIGVDMTPEMVEKARKIAIERGIKNVEFRLGEIENLPVADNSIDLVISNCVINLSSDKERVFKEIFRVLKPGGRVSISDIVLLKVLPKEIEQSVAAYTGCVAGAILIDNYKDLIEKAGITSVVLKKNENLTELKGYGDIFSYISSVIVTGKKSS